MHNSLHLRQASLLTLPKQTVHKGENWDAGRKLPEDGQRRIPFVSVVRLSCLGWHHVQRTGAGIFDSPHAAAVAPHYSSGAVRQYLVL